MKFNLDSEDKIFLQSFRRETQESLRQIRVIYNSCSEIAGVANKDDNSMNTVEDIQRTLSQLDSLQSQLNRQKKILSRTRRFLLDYLSPSQRERYEIR
jgi:hypothetical protein